MTSQRNCRISICALLKIAIQRHCSALTLDARHTKRSPLCRRHQSLHAGDKGIIAQIDNPAQCGIPSFHILALCIYGAGKNGDPSSSGAIKAVHARFLSLESAKGAFPRQVP